MRSSLSSSYGNRALHLGPIDDFSPLQAIDSPSWAVLDFANYSRAEASSSEDPWREGDHDGVVQGRQRIAHTNRSWNARRRSISALLAPDLGGARAYRRAPHQVHSLPG